MRCAVGRTADASNATIATVITSSIRVKPAVGACCRRWRVNSSRWRVIAGRWPTFAVSGPSMLTLGFPDGGEDGGSVAWVTAGGVLAPPEIMETLPGTTGAVTAAAFGVDAEPAPSIEPFAADGDAAPDGEPFG